jgi:hypothetical protein
MDCLKIPAQATQPGGIGYLESILGLLKSLKILSDRKKTSERFGDFLM